MQKAQNVQIAKDLTNSFLYAFCYILFASSVTLTSES